MGKKMVVWFSLIILITISFTTWSFITPGQNENPTKTENILANFSPKTVPSGTDSQYIIDLTMTKEGRFHSDTAVIIKNTSKDSWSKLVFYFIPNMFTKENSPQLNDPATLRFKRVSVNGKTSDYHLLKDTLSIPLDEKLKPGQEIKIQLIYEFTLPKEGIRFTKKNGNYYLAQFYPMLATYRNHKWNKEPYQSRGETYHTSFSNFKVDYDIPEPYTLVSTSEDEHLPSQHQGSFTINRVKEVYLALLKKAQYATTKSGHTTIRVFGDDKDKCQEIAKEAAEVFSFYQEKIGPYPFKQLDIVTGTMGMEYPGIVTVGSIYNKVQVDTNQLKSMVNHEIAHQWFYGMISNDPYHDAWLDEGFASFAQSLYSYAESKEEPNYHFYNVRLKSLEKYPINLSLDQYKNVYQSNYIYGKSVAMLWKLFEDRGGIKGAEDFLKSYYHFYKYKEVDTEEFVRFTKHYFNMVDDSFFKEWLFLE